MNKKILSVIIIMISVIVILVVTMKNAYTEKSVDISKDNQIETHQVQDKEQEPILVEEPLEDKTVKSSVIEPQVSSVEGSQDESVENKLPDTSSETLFGAIQSPFLDFEIVGDFDYEDYPVSFMKDGKVGFKDKNGQVIVEPVYGMVHGFGMVLVVLGQITLMVHIHGKELILTERYTTMMKFLAFFMVCHRY